MLLFLAKLLPLTERSGVNLGGTFNADNDTPVEDVAEVGSSCSEACGGLGGAGGDGLWETVGVGDWGWRRR